MGKGNPESAKAVAAHESDIFIADTLSQKTRDWFDDKRPDMDWIELRANDGISDYQKFAAILKKHNIKHKPFQGDAAALTRRLDEILALIPDEDVEEMATDDINPIEEAF